MSLGVLENELACQRLHGGSVADCACRLPEGGFLLCPEKARGVLVVTAVPPAVVAKHAPAPTAGMSVFSPSNEGKKIDTTPAAPSYSGDVCHTCGSPNMVRTGTCLTCQDCGDSSGGCS